MAAQKISNLKTYLAALSPERRKALESLRKTIRAGAPMVEEGFSYGIPGFKRDGRAFLWCAAWARHYSIYPITPAMLEVLQAEPRTYETSKGTVRFPADEPLPLRLIRRPVQARLSEPAR